MCVYTLDYTRSPWGRPQTGLLGEEGRWVRWGGGRETGRSERSKSKVGDVDEWSEAWQVLVRFGESGPPETYMRTVTALVRGEERENRRIEE